MKNKSALIMMIVDDIPENTLCIRESLKMSDYRLVFETNGKSAHEIARNILPDLILLDIVMLDADGIDVCRELKNCTETRGIPVIFLTGHKTELFDIAKGFEAGCIDYVTKPFHPEVLNARIETHIKLKRLHEELEYQAAAHTAELEQKTVALNVLMDKRESDRQQTERTILSNVREHLLPLLDNLKNTTLNSYQENLINAIKAAINTITSQFTVNLSITDRNLTRSEIRIARLICEGKTSKEISVLLSCSESVVMFHRNNIRKKLGLVNKDIHLSSYLQSFGTSGFT